MDDEPLRFDQIHIDVARNSTDDFNPFHDALRWRDVVGNPFGAPIALGFQMAFLAVDRVRRVRVANEELTRIERYALNYSNVELHFADALRAGEEFAVQAKKTIDRCADDAGLSNRVIVRKKSRGLALMGTVSETAEARFLADVAFDRLPSLEHLPDRSRVPGSPYFLKRKFLNASNAKNFAVGALCEQHDYFDELSERVYFAPMFTAALMSCALLELGRAAGHDFSRDPLVYTSHQISIDNRIQRRLRSNDTLHILVDGPLPVPHSKGLGKTEIEQQAYDCFGLVHHREVLFRARLQLAALHAISALVPS